MIGVLGELAKTGGRIAREQAAGVTAGDVRAKGLRDWVSHVDELVEDALVRRIRARYPDHQILGEEGTDSRGDPSRPLWIIDPIDGTTNFLHGIPAFAVSIALCERGEPRYAAVYDPMRDELFTAEAGAGLWLNGVRSYTSGCTDLSRALVGSALPFRHPEAMDECARVFLAMQAVCDDQRRIGACSLDLAYVAVGRLDAFYELGIHCWDTAAGELLVRSGGGGVSDYRGGTNGLTSRRSIVAGATPALHAAVLERVRPLAGWLDRHPFDQVP